MEVTVLASGSRGNCICIEGNSGVLLVDAGLSAREVLRRLRDAGRDAGDVEAVLVTHEHTDHIRGVDVLARRLGVPVFGTGGTLAEFSRIWRSTAPIRMKRLNTGEPFGIGDFMVEAFPVSHDANEPCGYLVSEGGVCMGCCTDTGVVTAGMMRCLERCDAVILESNHCPDMLENGSYPEFLKRRIRSTRGHLSNRAAAACLNRLAGSIHAAVLAHLSEVNNTPEKARSSAQNGLGVSGGSVELAVAHQNPGNGAVRIRL